jgi:DNA-binding response OmpR family regulator
MTDQVAAVLIVEDDSFISLFLQKKLTELGYKATVTATTAQALEALSKEPADLILLDIILPDENGFTLLDRLKKNPAYQDIPVIILSNLGQQSEIERGKQLGAVDFLVKGNYSPVEIVERVTKILKEQHRPPSQ